MTGSSTIGNTCPFVKVSRARDNQGDGERWSAEQVHPTLNAFDNGDARCVCAVVQGLDLYNFAITGAVSMTIRHDKSDNDHIPCIIVKGLSL